MTEDQKQQAEKSEGLDEIINHLEQEARMVLPGIQTLFGFQLIAVFNQRFQDLSSSDQVVHYASLILSVVSILLVMTPAAYHRQAEPNYISSYFCRLASRLLTFAMVPLALGISLDVYVIGKLVFRETTGPFICAAALLSALVYSWFVFPMRRRADQRLGSNLKKQILGER